MNDELLCSEDDAVRMAGVSLRTLLRFSEAGYLTLHRAPDGTHQYERAQVEEIFGASAAMSVARPTGTSSTTHRPQQDAVDLRVRDTRSAQSVPTPDTLQSSPSVPYNTGADSCPSLETEIKVLSDEIARLRNLLTMQDRILDSKDDEIADLRSQRAWLRERIEKLEEKSDRDQILLLSETQTIRSLIAYQESRKSTFRQFLEWTGLLRDGVHASLPQPQSGDYQSKTTHTPSSSRTIEVSKAVNSD
jgi:hypothetical protein